MYNILFLPLYILTVHSLGLYVQTYIYEKQNFIHSSAVIILQCFVSRGYGKDILHTDIVNMFSIIPKHTTLSLFKRNISQNFVNVINIRNNPLWWIYKESNIRYFYYNTNISSLEYFR